MLLLPFEIDDFWIHELPIKTLAEEITKILEPKRVGILRFMEQDYAIVTNPILHITCSYLRFYTRAILPLMNKVSVITRSY